MVVWYTTAALETVTDLSDLCPEDAEGCGHDPKQWWPVLLHIHFSYGHQTQWWEIQECAVLKGNLGSLVPLFCLGLSWRLGGTCRTTLLAFIFVLLLGNSIPGECPDDLSVASDAPAMRSGWGLLSLLYFRAILEWGCCNELCFDFQAYHLSVGFSFSTTGDMWPPFSKEGMSESSWGSTCTSDWSSQHLAAL